MTAAVGTAEVARFRDLLTERLGWSLADMDPGPLTEVLYRRASDRGSSVREYLRHVAAADSGPELAALAEELTITETYFFRNAEQFRVVADVALPERLLARADRRRLRLVSVGCSSGEEAYSLAIVARESVPDPSWDVSVLGLDVNPAMLRRAAAGRYSPWSLRETSPVTRQRWFRADGQTFELDASIRAGVRFLRYNVADHDPRLWPAEEYDVVFCRNLLMYLTPQTARALLARMTHALAPGGYLFLGHTDTLGSRPPGLRVRSSHDTFYYQRPVPAATVVGSRERSGVPAADRFTGAPAGGAATLPRPAESGGRGGPQPVRCDAPSAGSTDWDVVARLFREERFADALALAGSLPSPTPDRALLHGVLLLQAGRLQPARQVCRRLLAREGLDADAHHLLGMCDEGDDDRRAAAEHYRVAAYLDPRFALPRLRLGVLARRDGGGEAAAVQLEQAIALLPHERDQRILFFGGGFGRHALIAMCRAELAACAAAR